MTRHSAFLVPCLALLLAPALSGCVWLAASGAIVGVTVAHQERTVGNALDDVRIKSAIGAALVEDSTSNFLNVSTTVVEGRVLLTGRVETAETRLDATRAAWGVEGVKKVDNEIEVTSDLGWLDRPQDIYIRTEVAADILADKSIKDVNYTIDVVNGVVYLMGIGQDKAEVDRVIAHANRFAGVKRVESYVVLKDDPARYFGVPGSGT
jgi:osmotically-inducible protein OsmY